MPPRKRKITDPDLSGQFIEPQLTAKQKKDFSQGIKLFNSGRYWEAHEAWEAVWRELTDVPEDDWEILLRGLIQLSAGLYGWKTGKKEGGKSNLKKARAKLAICNKSFLGLDFPSLVSAIDTYLKNPDQTVRFHLPIKNS